jgi:hypothetical protein
VICDDRRPPTMMAAWRVGTMKRSLPGSST